MSSQFKKIESLIRDLIKEERYQKNSEEKLKNFIKSVIKEAEIGKSQIVNYIDICGYKKSIKVDSSEQYNEFYTTNFDVKPNKLIYDETEKLYVTNWVAYGLPANPNETQIQKIRAKNNCISYSKDEIMATAKSYNPLKGAPEPMKGVTVDNTALNLQGRNYAVGNEETIAWLNANKQLSPEELKKRDNFALGMVAFAFSYGAPLIAFIMFGPASAAIGAATILGGYVSTGLFTISAIEKARNGDYQGAGLDALWSILGFMYPKGLLNEAFKYLPKLGQNGIKNLRAKIETKQPLTNLEYLAMKEIQDNPEVIGKLIKDVLKENKVPTGNLNPIDAAKKAFKG
jgi:hypothetical protein